MDIPSPESLVHFTPASDPTTRSSGLPALVALSVACCRFRTALVSPGKPIELGDLHDKAFRAHC